VIWPPVVDDLKEDIGREVEDVRDDVRLQTVLDAAVAFVERVHAGRYDFTGADLTLPDPPDDICLGTLRLAGRYHARRRSVDGLVDMAELGLARIPSFDPDIDQLLRIGRWSPGVFA
jgi:hypothetical protein